MSEPAKGGGLGIGKLAGIAVAIVGAVAAVIAIVQYFQAQVPTFGTATNVSNQQDATSLISFLRANDSKIVHLDILCTGSGGACDAASAGPQSASEGDIVIVQANGNTYWLHFLTGSATGVQVDNGS